MASTAVRNKRGTWTATVEVDIDVDQLVSDGWHHEDDCPAPAPDPALTAAARSVHEAAGHRLADIAACGEEPCRSLPLSTVLATMSSR